MFQPILIIPFRVVFPVMGPPAFLPAQGRDDDGLRQTQERFQFDGLQQIRVETRPLVVNDDPFIFFFATSEFPSEPWINARDPGKPNNFPS